MNPKEKTILIVDDDRLVLAALSQALHAAGYRVKTATDGQEAIALSQQMSLDLVVLDIRMPGKDGIDVAHWLRQNTRLPFIFLTAYGEEDAVKQAVDTGALGYLIKPVDPPQLLAAIKTALQLDAENQQLLEREGQLTRALSGDRKINTAIGILMERERISEKDAFELLRDRARSRRRKLTEVATELIAAAEVLNNLSASTQTSRS